MQTDTSIQALFICFSRSSLGHVVRCSAAAARFRERGHRALVACSSEAASVPNAAGVPWLEISEIEPAPGWWKIQSLDEMRALVRRRLASPQYLSRCLDEESALIHRIQPDVVISDMRNSAGVAASMAGVPSMAIHNLRLFVSPMNVILPEVLQTLTDLGIADEHARKVLGDVMIVPDFSTFDPLSSIPTDVASLVCSLPREIRYVGPLLAREPSDLPERSELLKRYGQVGRPLISVTLGGSSVGREGLVEILEGLTGVDVDLVVTTGPGIEKDYLNPTLERWRAATPRGTCQIAEYRDDALEVMRACDVAIVHGGHGTTMEGLYCGTPMVFVPQTREQLENSENLARMGVGFVADPEQVRSKIRALTLCALESNMKQRCARLATKLARMRGADALVDFAEAQILLQEHSS